MRSLFYRIVLFFFFSSIAFVVSAQKVDVLIDNGIRKVYNADTLSVYGLDFSVLKLVNAGKLEDGPEIKAKFFPWWAEDFGLYNPKYKLEKYIKVKYLNYQINEFQKNQYLKSDEKNIIILESQLNSLPKIEEVVKDYNLLENEGVGLSIIVEEFHKRQEKVTVLFVFFNVSNKELLYVFRDYGEANGFGMRYHWLTGIQDPINSYVYFRYKKERKKNRDRK